MNHTPLPIALRLVLVGAVLFCIISSASAVLGWQVYTDENSDEDFAVWCLTGCNHTDNSHLNNTDGLWGKDASPVQYIIRDTPGTEYAYAQWGIRLNATRGEIEPSSLDLDVKIYSSGNIQVLISPDNSTWYIMDINTTNPLVWRDAVATSNMTQDKLMDFINASNWFNIYLTLNQTAASSAAIFAGFNLTGESLYNASLYSVSNCTNPDHGKALEFRMYDETSQIGAVKGYFENMHFTFDQDNGTEWNMAVVNNAANETHHVCIYPYKAQEEFEVDLHAVYTAEGYSQRSWYLSNTTIDGSLGNSDKINIYVINDTDDDQIAIHVRDENLNDREGAEIRVMRNMGADYITVTILETNSEGKAFVWLDIDEWYKLQVLEGGTVYHTSTPTQFVGKDTTSNPHVLDVTFGEALPYISYIGGIAYSGTWDEATEIYTLTVADGTGLMASGHITVQQLNLTGEATICWENATSASFTITCDISGHPNGTYAITSWLEMTAGDYFIVNSSLVYLGEVVTQLTNQDGLILSVIIVGTAGMAGIIHPALMVMTTIVGLIAVAALNIALIGMEVILPIVFIGVIIIYLVRK